MQGERLPEDQTPSGQEEEVPSAGIKVSDSEPERGRQRGLDRVYDAVGDAGEPNVNSNTREREVLAPRRPIQLEGVSADDSTVPKPESDIKWVSNRIIRVVGWSGNEHDVLVGFGMLGGHGVIEIDEVHRPRHDAVVDTSMLDVTGCLQACCHDGELDIGGGCRLVKSGECGVGGTTNDLGAFLMYGCPVLISAGEWSTDIRTWVAPLRLSLPHWNWPTMHGPRCTQGRIRSLEAVSEKG